MSINYVRERNLEIRRWLLRVFEYAAALPKDKLARRTCPVCGSGTSKFFANNGYLDYERCRECMLVFMNPAIPPDSVRQGFGGDDELLMDYFRIVMKYRSERAEKPDPATDGKLVDVFRIKQSGNLLDVGCSVGEFLHKAKYFYDVEGVEVNPHTAEVAAQHFKVHRKVLSSLNLGKDYDIVTLHQILYGVPDPVELLRDIHKILRDDGILYINTPNADSHAVRLFQGKASHLYGYTTLNLFNHRSLVSLAEKTGFRLRSFRTEWLDIYLTDLLESYEHPDKFIHKKNIHIEGYEDRIQREDDLHKALNPDLGMHGNYIVAVLEKAFAGPVPEGRD